ncbi:hypothetical protein M0D21_06005 [Aquimarina sp. D1M17]|uniref:hypothetical protein n=1 Tax=Aquimarina acroporae TaxID=2937283 RepID=UPI0020BEA4B6|nr:hypothetical protein [Aquimarina acroporae]MCK8521109.1 hypothetical protein [Aquimarina acroporae]
MKKLLILVFAIVLGTSQLFANNNPTKSPEQQLRNQIALLLESPEIVVEQGELKAQIEFTLNSKGEVVVLSVNAEREIVESFVKSRLNYKKVDSDIANKGNRVFQITLKIRKPKDA